ncbi:MAG: beta-aspartyl-peptidase [Myxococcales bacterium]|nr:beta-aspartyl-peptidase [Myxococcales bacterium]
MPTPALLPPPPRPLALLRQARAFGPLPLGVVDILVGGGEILAIGTDLPVPAGLPCERIALAGACVVPGFVDAHVHLQGGGGEAGAATRVPEVAFSDLTTAGVTTAIGLLGTDATTRGLAGLLAAARALDELGLTALCYTGSYEVPPVTLTGSVRGDLVHIDRIVAVGELAISDHRSSQPTFDEFVRIAADAHVAGLMTGKAGLLHLHLGDGPRGLDLVRRALDATELPARTFHPTHCNRNRRLWGEAQELTRRGVTIDVTAFPAEDDAPGAADAIAEFLIGGFDRARLTVSSDGGGCLPAFDGQGNLLHMDVGRCGALAEAMAELLAAGHPLETVLPFFTSNVAHTFRLHRKGRLRVGGDADLIVLDEAGRPRDVMAGGRWVVLAGVPKVRGLFEAGQRLG